MDYRKGFTLVELLAVVSIITLLLSIMLPTLQGTSDTLGQLRCQTNHRNISASMYAYAFENLGTLVHPNWRSVENGLWSSKHFRVRGWLYENNMENVPSDRWVEGGIVYETAQNLEVLRCPMEPMPADGWTWWTNIWTSYCMNGAVVSYGDKTDKPHNMAEMIPNGVAVWDSKDEQWNDGSSFPREGLAYHHRDGATYAAFDGSAPYITRDKFEQAIYTRPSILNCDPWASYNH